MAVTPDLRSDGELAARVGGPAPDHRRGVKVLRDGSTLAWWRELLVVGALYLMYEAVRDVKKSGAALAFRNAQRVLDWEAALHLDQELGLHEWARRFEWLIVASNYFYGTAYWMVTLFVIVWLYVKRADDYPLWRNALMITTFLGLIGFALFPLMPPRLLDALGGTHFGFVDTLVKYPTFWSFDSGPMTKVSNQFAAMPSLHCAWALWASCAMFPRVRSWWAKTLFLLYTPVQVFCVVVTSNHYFIDAVAGFAIVGIGYVIARALTRAGRRAPLDAAPAPATAG